MSAKFCLNVLLAFDVVVLQFVPTSAIQHSSFNFSTPIDHLTLFVSPFNIQVYTIQHPSLRNSTSKFTQFNNSEFSGSELIMKIWTRDYWDTNPASGRVEALSLGPPDDNTSALIYITQPSCLLRIKEITPVANHNEHRQANEPILQTSLFFETSYHKVSLTIWVSVSVWLQLLWYNGLRPFW